MKILEIHINAFGKLENIDFSLDSGVNCIFEDNEYGKSTLLAFVRAMLYGFPPRSSASIRDFGRQKYKPWSGAAMGGSMLFKVRGTQYLLKRQFGDRRSEDELEIFDTGSGASIALGDEEVGQFLFGINEPEFIHTVFVGQMLTDFSQSKQLMSISDRLTGLSTLGDDTYSYEVVSRRIDEAMKALRNKRGGGRIPELSARLAELENIEHAAFETLDRVAALDDEKRQLESQVLSLDNQIQVARKESALSEASDVRAMIQEKTVVSDKQDREVEAYLSRIDRGIFSLQEQEREAMARLEEIHTLKILLHTDSREKNSRGSETVQSRVRSSIVGWGAVLTSMIAVLIVLDWAFFHVMRQPLFFLFWIPTLLLWGLFFMLRSSERRTEKVRRQMIDNREVEFSEDENSVRAQIVFAREKLAEARQNREAFLIQVAKLNAARELEIQSLSDRLNNLDIKMNGGEPGKEGDYYSQPFDDSEAVEKWVAMRFEVTSRISNIEGATESLRSMIPDLSAIQEEAAGIAETIADAERHYQALNLAKKALEEASEEMRRVFAPPVREKASEYLALLTEGRYASLSFDRAFHVRAGERQTDEKSAEYFSAGTVDQIYLALRLAISDVILEQYPNMPIFLDDALVQYDLERAECAVKMLKSMSGRRQIIMLTCHEHIAKLCGDA